MHFARIERTLKTRPASLVATLLVLGVGACGDSVTGVDTTTDDLIGTWNITSLTFEPGGGGTVAQGLVGSATIVFSDDLTYTLTFVEGTVTDIENGTFAVDGSTLSLTPTADQPSVFTVTAISSTGATLYSEDESFDFNDDGEETDATLTVTLQKQ
jgi:Lipocalin-like domain